jgi:hypothetical protein
VCKDRKKSEVASVSANIFAKCPQAFWAKAGGVLFFQQLKVFGRKLKFHTPAASGVGATGKRCTATGAAATFGGFTLGVHIYA